MIVIFIFLPFVQDLNKFIISLVWFRVTLERLWLSFLFYFMVSLFLFFIWISSISLGFTLSGRRLALRLFTLWLLSLFPSSLFFIHRFMLRRYYHSLHITFGNICIVVLIVCIWTDTHLFFIWCKITIFYDSQFLLSCLHCFIECLEKCSYMFI